MSRNNRKKESNSSAYERRTYRLPYNPAPLEEDYDPLFDPEAFAPSPVKKKGRKTQKDAVEDPESSRHGKRLSDLFDIENSTSLQSKRASKPQPVHKFPPFSKYFAGLGLKLLSDDDAHPEHEDEEEEEEEEEEGSEADDESDHSRPERAILTAKSRVSTASSSKKQINGSHASGSSTRRKAINGNSDSEEDILPKPPRPGQPYEWMKPPLKRKSPGSDVPAAKKAKFEEEESQAQTQSTVQTQTQTQPLTQGSTAEPPADDSVTEPESEESITEPESDPQTESETEPESDAELPQMHFHPRPSNIERKPDQPLLGPLVLDEGGVPGRRKKTQVPGSINTYLRDYQRDGIRFFWERYKDGYGGLLGDDMGLVTGKTIQVIGFLSAIMGKLGDNRDENRRREHVSKLQDGESWKLQRTLPPANETWPTCLIIAPSSVVPNWERELHKWGYFEVGVYANGKEERSQVLRDFKYGRLDVVVTSFDLARKDIALLDDLPWSCIIVDEVHRVKNPKSKLTDAFNDFRCHVRFGLTGTAIQNSFSELWTILDWANRGSVGTRKEWESYVAKPLMRGQSKSASAEELSNAYEVARILRDDILPKYFLRRTKELIKDQLPEKTDEVVFCPLAPRQLEAYKRVLKTEAVQNLIRKDRPCDCGSKKPRKSCCHKSDQGDLFKYMSTLIKISNHLALILPAPSDKAEQVLRNRELSEQIFPKGAVPKYGTSMLEPEYCGKWLVLESLLKEWHKNKSNKVLIFTKSVKLLDMLDFHLKAQGLGHVKLDGQVKQNDRMALIDQFQEDPDVFVFLISTMAGGTGLNLTAANKVVIFDPNWNPAHDLQAMDRAYRYGQTRNVSVYRLLGAGSLEELIYARQVYKQQQMAVGYNASTQTRYFEGVQGDKSKQGELFGIKNIFKLHEETLATKMAIEKATLSDLDWALANIKPERKPDGTKWVYEAESKAKKHDGELNGLGALLFDDGFVPEPQGEDGIQKALKDIGVTYIHRNEDLIAENTIQRQRLKHMIEEEKKKAAQKAAAKGKGKNAPLQREKTWPPKRKHHKPAPTPEQKLQARQKALLELGYVDSIDGLATFAQEFARKSREEQNDLLSELDKHTRR